MYVCMFPCFLSAAVCKSHTPCIVHLFSIFSWPGSSITWQTTRVFGAPRTTAMHIAAEARSMEVGGVLHWWFNKWFISTAIIIPMNLGSKYGIKYQAQLVSRISSINSTLYFNKASFKKWCSFSKLDCLSWKVLKLLLERGASSTAKDHRGRTPAHCLALNVVPWHREDPFELWKKEQVV